MHKRLRNAARMFQTVGAGLMVSGVARLLPMIGVVNKLGELSKMKDAATALNMTAEGASGLFGMLSSLGGDFKEDLEGITQFGARVGDALKGVGGPTGEAARLFEGLSVQAKDLEGIPLDEQFLRVLSAIRELPQGLQANRLALIGGTDSMKKWLALLARSPEQLRAMVKSMAVSAEEMDEAQRATLAYKEATRSLGVVWRNVAVALAGVVEVVSGWASQVFGPMADMVRRNRAVVVGFVAMAAASVALGAALVAVGMAISGALTVFGAVASVVAFLVTPLGLAVAAVAALAAGFVYLTGVGRTLGDTFGGVVAALSFGDLELAWRIALAGLELEWVSLVEKLTLIWNDFKSFFVDAWHDAIMLVKLAFVDLFDFLKGQFGSWFTKVAMALKMIDRASGGVVMGLGTVTPLLDLAQEVAIRDADKVKDEIFAAARIAQAERDAARRGDAEGARADRAAAEARRAELLREAALWGNILFQNAAAAGKAADATLPDPTAEIARSVKGAFLGFGSAQAAFGGSGPAREITKRLDKIVAKTDEEIAAIEEVARALGGGGPVWSF